MGSRARREREQCPWVISLDGGQRWEIESGRRERSDSAAYIQLHGRQVGETGDSVCLGIPSRVFWCLPDVRHSGKHVAARGNMGDRCTRPINSSSRWSVDSGKIVSCSGNGGKENLHFKRKKKNK